MKKVLFPLFFFGVFLFGAFYSWQFVGAERIATLSFSFTPEPLENNVILRGEETMIGTVTMKASGEKLDIEHIFIEGKYNTEHTPFQHVLFRNEFGSMVTYPSAIGDTEVITTSFRQPFSLDDGEEMILAMYVELGDSAQLGQEIQLRFPGENFFDISGPERYDTPVEASFPVETNTLIISDANVDTLLKITAAEEVGSVIASEAEDISFGSFAMTVYGKGTVEVNELTFRTLGNIETTALTNLRLENEGGEVLAGPLDITSSKLIFTDPFSLPSGTTETITLRGDIGAPAETDDTIGFEIAAMPDVLADDPLGEKNVSIANTFPVQTVLKTVGDADVSVAFAEENPPAGLISPGQHDILLGQFVVENGTTARTLQSITFEQVGSAATEKIQNWQLVDEGGAGFEQSRSGDTILFSGNIDLAAGEERVFSLYGDLSGSGCAEQTVRFSLNEITFSEETSPPSAFPLITSTMTITAGEQESLTTVSLRSFEPYTFPKTVPLDNAPLFWLSFESAKTVEITDLRFDYTGTAPETAFSNLRLLDENKNARAFSIGIENGQLLFSTPLLVPAGSSEFLVVADMDANLVTEEETVQFILATSEQIVADHIQTYEPVKVAGNFPIEMTAAAIAKAEDVKYVSIVMSDDQGRDVKRGAEEEFAKLHLTAQGDELRLERVVLQIIGETDEDVTDLKLVNEEGVIVMRDRNLEDNVVIFEDQTVPLPQGTEVVLSLVATVRDNTPNDHFFAFSILSAEYVEAETLLNQKEAEIIGNFPIESGFFTISMDQECTDEYAPVCGWQYNITCVTSPCEPTASTFSNQCYLEQSGGLFLYNGECAEKPLNPIRVLHVEQCTEENEEFFEDSPPEEERDPEEESGQDEAIEDSLFPDIDPNSLEGKAATFLAEQGIINGYPDGEFKGDILVNRAELAKFLLLTRYQEIASPVSQNRFPDVELSDWFADVVITAAEEEIIEGYPDGYFRPEDAVNTAEFLKMLTRTFRLPTGLGYEYEDVEDDDWFAEYAGSAEYFYLFPKRDDFLFPGKELSRYEVAVAIYQYLQNQNTI